MGEQNGSSAPHVRPSIDPTIAAVAATSFLIAGSATVLTVSGGIYMFRHPIQAGRHLAAISMRLAGVSLQRTLLDGKRIHYYEHGPHEGTPMVLLHGLGDAAESWAGVMRGFARMYPDRWVLAPDVPGLGYSPRPAGSLTIDTITKSVLHFLETLNIGRAIFAGNSTGGQVVLHLAARNPERVAHAIAIDPTGFTRGQGADIRVQNREEARALLSRVLGRERRVPDFILDDIVRTVQTDHVTKFIETYDPSHDDLDAGGDDSDLARLARSSVPVTIIFGSEDRLLPEQCPTWFREALPRAETLVLAGAGHTPQIDLPGELTALLAERGAGSRLVATY